jgi:Fur family iron response transcriptional regulator
MGFGLDRGQDVSSNLQIAEQLRDKGVKPTSQRVEIAAVLLEKPCHLSAEQILCRLNKSGRRISKATVYNTLKLFTEQGLIRQVAADRSRLFYDSTTDFHHHFYNADTGELVDINAGNLKINGLPPLPEGTQAESIELIVRLRNKG